MSDTWTRRKSRRAARRRIVILACRSVSFVALALSALVIVLYLLFPVEQVRVEGNRMLADSEITRNIPDRTNLALIHAGSLQANVDSNVWVEGVSVNKDWDSGMVSVQVEERDAALNASLKGGERVILSEDGTRLPGLGGASLSELEVDEARLEEIRAGQKSLEESGVEVESVDSVGAQGIEVSVRRPEGPPARALFSGEIGAGQARVLEGLLDERPDARYFDLRTPERVVVGGEPDSGGDEPNSSSG